MREGWTKRDYSIPLPLKIVNGKITETQHRTDHGYVNGPFAIRLHCTTELYGPDRGGQMSVWKVFGKSKPQWEITHIPSGALLPVEFKTLKRSQEFCEAMLRRGKWRFRSTASPQVPAFREAMRQCCATTARTQTDRRSAAAGDSRDEAGIAETEKRNPKCLTICFQRSTTTVNRRRSRRFARHSER